MIKRRKTSLPIIPTASMGDIAFLLIIFFMLASNFMKSANVKAEEPASPDVEQQEPALVSVIYDQEGKLWLQGVEIGMGELAGGVQVAVGDDRKLPVNDKIDKARTGVDFLPVIRSLSEAGVRIMLTGARADEPAAPGGISNQDQRGSK